MTWATIQLIAHVVIATLIAAASLAAAGHAILNKRDPRSALGWVAVCLLVPVAGVLFYLAFGVNRVRRRALDWKQAGERLTETGVFRASERIALPRGSEPLHLQELRHLADSLTHRPVVGGNRLVPLHDGESAYPAMLEALEQAKSSIHLATYIFDADHTGRSLAEALVRAAARGVQVRVLLDGLGERYSRPSARRLFRGSRVEIARFLPLRRGLSLNLRNHRKILVVDGLVGFTGGMNLGDRHLVRTPSRKGPVSDLHFRVDGPVVHDLQRVFLEDWFFATREIHDDPAVFPVIPAAGEAAARVVDDGPDERNRKLHWMIIGALACATKSVRIMTPYFVPDRALLAALGAAALRGIRVTLLLPGKNNLVYMHWATRAYLGELLEFAIDVRYQPPPFVHTKLFVVDDVWSLIGSANLDPRSLRLNFELDLEVYDAALGGTLARFFDEAAERSRAVTVEELRRRPLWQKLRDGGTKLFSPYL